MTSTETNTEGPLARALRRMIDLQGLSGVSAELGVSREALARYLARIALQRGTHALIERKLGERLDADRKVVAAHVRAAYRCSPADARAAADATLAPYAGVRARPAKRRGRR